jgi:hypothetical protein
MLMSASEIAQLRRYIELECEAMQRAMTGSMVGSSFHQFIYMRMLRIGGYQERLASYVGEQGANHIVGELYCNVMEGGENTSDAEATSL